MKWPRGIPGTDFSDCFMLSFSSRSDAGVYGRMPYPFGEREFRWAIAVSIAAFFSGFLFCGVLCQHISFELCCLFGHPSHFGLSYPRASALWGVTLRGSVSPFFLFFLLFRIRCLVLTLTSTLLFFLLARWTWILFDILNRNWMLSLNIRSCYPRVL